MPHPQRGVAPKRKAEFARWAPGTYATVCDGIVRALVAEKVGRNGWAVALCLLRAVFSDGKLGRRSSKSMSDITGLSAKQIERGMAELRDKGIIEPVHYIDDEGYARYDRSNFRHVAQYRIERKLWKRIVQEQGETPKPERDDS